MGIDFYFSPGSPPCRAVHLAAEAVGVQLDMKLTDLQKKQHLEPDFLKINPRHTVPAISDNGFILCESRAILQYLANAYAKNDSLYPRPAKQRALVDQMLYFDMGALNKCMIEAYIVVLLGYAKEINPEKVKATDTNLEYLEEVLTKSKFAAGDQITIADFAIIPSITTIEACGHKFAKYPLITAYINRCKDQMKGYKDANQKYVDMIRGMWKNVTAPKA